MTATYSEAIDAMFTLFNTAWKDGATAIVGNVPQIRWQGVESAGTPPMSNFWARVLVQNVTEKQTSFESGIASDEKKRYTAHGLLFVQIYCPMSHSRSMEKGRQLAELARNAFRGKQTVNGVWFRNANIIELTPQDDSYRINVVIEYEYDEIG
jgi:hypothetical protein